MPQVTIYLDEETEAQIQKHVRQEGVSREQWIAKIIREKLAAEWPEEVVQLAGAWKDFPSLEEIRSGLSHAPSPPLPRQSHTLLCGGGRTC